jgi:hypothetical protein
MGKRRTTRDGRDFGVSVIRASGGKRKGKSMKRKPSEVRVGYITREQLQNAPAGADVWIDSKGKGRMIEWTPPGRHQ